MANQVTVLLDPTQMPNQSQDQATFDKLWAAVLANLPTFGAQLNAAIASFNAAASGMAYAIPYTVDLSSTADADPGSGALRFDNATQNAATTLRLDLFGAGGTIDYTAMIDTFDASTSTVKGQIRIVKQGDASKFLFFDVTARTAPSGYRDIIVTPRASSSANPFAQGDAVLLFFQRTGDKGDFGPNGAMYLLGATTVASGASLIDFPSIFSGSYDKYLIEVESLGISSGVSLNFRFDVGGVADTSASYGVLAANGASMGAGSGTAVALHGSTNGASLTIAVRNPNSTGGLVYKAKGIGVSGYAYNTSTSAYNSVAGEAFYSGGAPSGFQLYPASGTFTSGTIRVYGIKNS